MNPGVWTTSIKLGAKLEGFLETDVHGPNSGPRKFTATEPPDLCWPEGMGPHTGYLVVVFWIVKMRDWAECTAKIGELGMLLPLHQLLSVVFDLVTRTFLIVWSYLKSDL